MEWSVVIIIWTQWITVMCVYKIFHDIKMTVLTRNMKRCSLPLALLIGVAFQLLSEELDHFQMTIIRSNVKWNVFVFIWVQWITVICVYKILYITSR